MPQDLVNRAAARLDEYGQAQFGGSTPDSFPAPPLYDTLRALIDSWDDSWPLDDAILPDNLDSLVQAIINSTAHGCCDGSLFMGKQSLDLLGLQPGRWRTQPLVRPFLVPFKPPEEHVQLILITWSYRASILSSLVLLLSALSTI